MNSRNTLVLGALLALGGTVFAFQQGQGRTRARGEAPQARVEGRRGELRGRFQRQRPVRERLQALNITEAQRDSARRTARELAPLAEEVRAKAREIVERARALRAAGDIEGARDVMHRELLPLLESARARAGEQARPLIESLTPQQRAKLDAFARQRGGRFDEERAAGRLGMGLGLRAARGAQGQRAGQGPGTRVLPQAGQRPGAAPAPRAGRGPGAGQGQRAGQGARAGRAPGDVKDVRAGAAGACGGACTGRGPCAGQAGGRSL